MLNMLVGFLFGVGVMALFRDERLEREMSELRKENERLIVAEARLLGVEAAAREVVELADEQPWDPAGNAFWHAVDRLADELREQ